MGHDISLINKETGEAIAYCFPLVGEGTFESVVVNGELKPLPFQSSLSITSNNSKMWYLAMKNIGHPVESIGGWLSEAIALSSKLTGD